MSGQHRIVGTRHLSRLRERSGDKPGRGSSPTKLPSAGRYRVRPLLKGNVTCFNRCSILLALLLCCFTAVSSAASDQESQPSFAWQRFQVAGRPAFVILPDAKKKQTASIPWVLYAPTFDRSLPNAADEGWMIRQFLAAGIAIAGIDVGESYGSPTGRDQYNALHKHVVKEFNFDNQASLLARSRGGLMLYAWAADNPDKVRCMAGIYPVCDLRSYPGLATACGAYNMTETELAAVLQSHNPVDRLQPLAKAKVPIFHIHGDQDATVPIEANSAAIQQRYTKLGGSMQLVIAQDQGHSMWPGFFECQPLVDFVIQQSGGSVVLPKPIAHWKLDDSGPTAFDSAGNHQGRIIGADSVDGKIGKGLLFDRASGNHIAIPYSKDFELSTFTVAAWVKLTKEPTFSGILGTRFGGDQTFDMKINTSKVHGDIGDGASWIETAVNFYADDVGTNGQGGDLPVGPWFHITFVIDSETSQCRLYLDADLKKTIYFLGKGKPVLMKVGQVMQIGASSPTEFMDGVIDDVRIWAGPLTGGQVRQVIFNR